MIITLTYYARMKKRPLLSLHPLTQQAIAASEHLLTPDGPKLASLIRPGDRVFSTDGIAYEVHDAESVGQQTIYRVRFKDGVHVDCASGQMFRAKLSSEDRFDTGRDSEDTWRDWSLSSIFSFGGSRPDGHHSAVIPTPAPLQYPDHSLPIDPYVLGCLLGDGGLTSGTAQLTSADQVMADEIGRRLPLGMIIRKLPSSKHGYSIRNAIPGGPNEIIEHLRSLDLLYRGSLSKFVPDIYLQSSAGARLLLLQGLMDTDGSVTEDGITLEFTSVSPHLRDAVVFLTRSFGGKVTWVCRKNDYPYKGEIRTGRWSFRVRPRLPLANPFLLPRKRDRFAIPTRTTDHRIIASVETFGYGDAVSISTAAPNGIFLTASFVSLCGATREPFNHESFSRSIEIATLSAPQIAELSADFRTIEDEVQADVAAEDEDVASLIALRQAERSEGDQAREAERLHRVKIIKNLLTVKLSPARVVEIAGCHIQTVFNIRLGCVHADIKWPNGDTGAMPGYVKNTHFLIKSDDLVSQIADIKKRLSEGEPVADIASFYERSIANINQIRRGETHAEIGWPCGNIGKMPGWQEMDDTVVEGLILDALSDGLTIAQIARRLNLAGHDTAWGKEWTDSSLWSHLKARKLADKVKVARETPAAKLAKSARQTASSKAAMKRRWGNGAPEPDPSQVNESAIWTVAISCFEKGLTNTEVASALNDANYRTFSGHEWTGSRLHELIRKLEKQADIKAAKASPAAIAHIAQRRSTQGKAARAKRGANPSHSSPGDSIASFRRDGDQGEST